LSAALLASTMLSTTALLAALSGLRLLLTGLVLARLLTSFVLAALLLAALLYTLVLLTHWVSSRIDILASVNAPF
jgi:hypothetical protein